MVQFWSDQGGRDEDVLDALRARRGLPMAEPSSEDWHTQLNRELALARRHLTAVLDHYYDSGLARKHKGLGVYPEDHLWRAAQGVREIEHALHA